MGLLKACHSVAVCVQPTNCFLSNRQCTPYIVVALADGSAVAALRTIMMATRPTRAALKLWQSRGGNTTASFH